MAAPQVIQKHPRILFFDGVCSLCSGFVRFVYQRDQDGLIGFVPQQSGPGAEVLRWMGLPENDLQMLIFVDHQQIYTRSAAFLKIAGYLGFPWTLLQTGWLVPGALRDWLYDQLAAVRYRVFGQLEACFIPTGELAGRFPAEGFPEESG